MPQPVSGADAAALTGLHQITVGVDDLDRATAFYRDVLGLPFLFTAPPGMSFFQCGDTRLLLGGKEANNGTRPPTSVLYFRVKDIGAAAARLRERGVSFGREPSRVATLADREVWLAEFRDSEGNPMALMSEPRLGAS
jgi:methylmalonyl-CoA/ethylmalonyl-CoA epimerase